MSYANNNYQSNYRNNGSGRDNYQNKQGSYQNGNQNNSQNSYPTNQSGQNGYKNNYQNNHKSGYQNNHKNKYEKLSTYGQSFYSQGMSVLTVSFYKTNLSFLFQPFTGTAPNGSDIFDKKGIITTINREGAAALLNVCDEILLGSVEATILTLQCANDVTLTLEMKAPGEVYLVISKDNQTIPFKFASRTVSVRENGINTTKVIESGLRAFMGVPTSYLLATNMAAHSAKLGEGFETQ